MENADSCSLDVRMPGAKENIFPWLEVVANKKNRFWPMTNKARFLPVIRRILVDEGEFVRAGQPILELEENEYYTSSVGNLLSPATGVVKKWHIRADHWGAWKKNAYIGIRQYTPNYGETLVTIGLNQPREFDDEEIGWLVVKDLVNGGKRSRILNMAGAIVQILVLAVASAWAILELAKDLASGWGFLLFVPLLFLVVGLAGLVMSFCFKKIKRNWDFVATSAFGVRSE